MIQLVTNQVDMTNRFDFRDTTKEMTLLTNQVKLMKSWLQINLSTHQVGAVQTKKTVPTVVKTKALAAGVGTAQQNEDGANGGPRLLMTASDGDASRVQTLLSVSDIHLY